MLTVIVHRHRLETSLYVHSILLQEEDQVGGGEEYELSADLRWLELDDLFLKSLDIFEFHPFLVHALNDAQLLA